MKRLPGWIAVSVVMAACLVCAILIALVQAASHRAEYLAPNELVPLREEMLFYPGGQTPYARYQFQENEESCVRFEFFAIDGTSVFEVDLRERPYHHTFDCTGLAIDFVARGRRIVEPDGGPISLRDGITSRWSQHGLARVVRQFSMGERIRETQLDAGVIVLDESYEVQQTDGLSPEDRWRGPDAMLEDGLGRGRDVVIREEHYPSGAIRRRDRWDGDQLVYSVWYEPAGVAVLDTVWDDRGCGFSFELTDDGRLASITWMEDWMPNGGGIEYDYSQEGIVVGCIVREFERGEAINEKRMKFDSQSVPDDPDN